MTAALAARYGLTNAEAELAEQLATGRSLAEVAQRRGRSLNTARTQLGGLLAKTGATRQSDLVRLLLAPDGGDAKATLPRLG